MKKIFSAFLLMTMMVASVGSFVSCSDIEESIAAVDEATKNNAASIKDLEGKIAALQTALQTAQSEAAAAKAEANAAKQAAATAKAEAIAAALAEIEKVNGDVDAVNAEIKKINDALAGCATKEAVELLQATIDEYKAITDENAEAIEAALAEIAKVQDDVDAANAEIKKINDALAGYATKEAVELLENTVKEYKALTDENATAIAEVEAAIKALKDGGVTAEKFAEVVAQMKAIDEALVNFVKAMANQIQSITYVPENVAGTIASSNFAYGTTAATSSNVIAFVATYDVRPANLASTITVDNAEFKGVPVTKAAAAEAIKVMKVEADDATGRVVVYGAIAKAQTAYTALTSADKQVAVALNVNTEAQVDSTDLGTKISSNYANIANPAAAKSVYDSFVLATADNKTAVKAYTNNKIEVPYNYVGTAAAEKVLFPVTVKFEIVKDKYITPAEASVLLGKALDVKYTAKVGTADVKAVYTAAPGATDKNDDDEITSPILVTGTDLSATATLVVSPDYEANETIGASAKLALGTWTVDNVNIGLTAEATYTIVDGKSDASVVIAPITKTWVYTDADNAWATVNAWKAVERNVTLPTELTTVESLIPTTEYLYAKWNVGTAAAPVYNYARAEVKFMSSKAVQVVNIVGVDYDAATETYTVNGTANPLTYAQAAEKTYTFEGVFQNPDTEIDYKVALDVVLGGMPDDKEIDLGTMPALVSNVPTKLDVNFVGKALAEHSAYLTGVKFSDVYSSFNGGTVTVTNADATAYTGSGVVTFTAAQKAANKPEVEASQVEIKQFAKGTYNVKYVKTVYGVKYTYKAVVEVAEPTYTLDTISQFVQNGQVIVSGVTTMPKFTLTKDADGNVTASTKTADAEFESDVINLKDYFMVSGLDKTYAGDVKVVYTVKTYAADTKFTALWGTETTIAKNTALATVSANSTVSATDGKTLTDAKVTWVSDVDKVEVTAYLVKASATETTDKDLAKVAYDKETITIVQRDRISSVAQIANTGTVEYKSGANVVDFLKFIETKDFNGNVLSNPYATNTTDYWYTPTGKGTDVVNANVAALYGQAIAIATPTCDLPTAAVSINADNQLVFTNNSAELQSNVVVTIPVYVGYEYDNYGSTAKKVEVKVTFTPKN